MDARIEENILPKPGEQIVTVKWKGGDDHLGFEQASAHNVRRIQAFLDVPLKEVGEASKSVRARLAERGLRFGEERSVQLPPVCKEMESELGIRSRFNEGDGTFWDRWVNSTGCVDGRGNYFVPTAPVRSGNLIPTRGFKDPLCQLQEVPLGSSALTTLLEKFEAKQAAQSEGGNTYVHTRDTVWTTNAMHRNAAFSVNDQISLMLEKLDLITRIDEHGRRHLALPSHGLSKKETAALAECFKVCEVAINSLDLSGNPALGESLHLLLQALATGSKESLAALDLSRVQLHASSIDALAASFSSGSFSALHTLCLASTGINDTLMTTLARALRSKSAPKLTAVDVSINAIGSSLSQFGVPFANNSSDDETTNARYLSAAQGGPLGALLETSRSKKLDNRDDNYHLGQSTLRVLNASQNLMRGDVSIGLARVIARHPSLTQLHLARNRFGDSGCVELVSAISSSSTLTFLDISGNEIGLKGAACLSVTAYRMPRLRRLLIGGNPIGVAGASLLLPLKFRNDDSNSEHDAISLVNCDLTSQDTCDFDMDWLFGVPLMRMPSEHVQFQRAPWRYKFRMDAALDKMLAQAILRITAASNGVYTYESCSVRHTAEFNREILRVARRRAENASGKAWSQKVAKMLLHMSVKPERKKNLKKMTDAMAFIGDVHSRFLKLERVTSTNSTRKNGTDKKRTTSNCPGKETREERRAFNIETVAAQLLAEICKPRGRRPSSASSPQSKQKKQKAILSKKDALDLLKSIDSECSTADVDRAFSLYDWKGDGLISRQRFLEYLQNELANYIRRENALATPYWTATFESEMKSRWEGIAREPEAAKKGGLFSSSTSATRAQKRRQSESEEEDLAKQVPWSLPSEGVVELRFNLSAAPPSWERCQISAQIVGRILLAVEEMGGQVDSVLRAVRLTGIKLRIDEAVTLSLALISRHTEEHGRHDEAQIQVLTAVLPIVASAQHARCTRDIVLNAGLPCAGKGIEACRNLRRSMGRALYQARLGTQAGHYELELSDNRDREALRLLIEADSAGSARDSEKGLADISQQGKRGRFRNMRFNDEPCCGTGGLRSHVDPRACHFGSVDCFAPGQTVFAIHTFFDCDNRRPEKRLLPSDSGAMTRGKVVFDFAPPHCNDTIYNKASFDAMVLSTDDFVQLCRRFGWVIPTVKAIPSESTPTALSQAFTERIDCTFYANTTRYCLGEQRCALSTYIVQHMLREQIRQEIQGNKVTNESLPQLPLSIHKSQVAATAHIAVESAAEACGAMRRARLRAQATIDAIEPGLSTRGTCGPDSTLEDALDLVSALPALTPGQGLALLEWCPLSDQGERPPSPPQNDKEDKEWINTRNDCGDRRIQLLAAISQRLLGADHCVWAQLLRVLTIQERGMALHRLGLLTAWSPLAPDGFYLLDMTVREDRVLAKALVLLEAAEPESVCSDLRTIEPADVQRELAIMVRDQSKLNINSNDSNIIDKPPQSCNGELWTLWRHGLPTLGLRAFTFASSPEPNMQLRHALAVLYTNNAPKGDGPYDFGTSTPAEIVATAIYSTGISASFFDNKE